MIYLTKEKYSTRSCGKDIKMAPKMARKRKLTFPANVDMVSGEPRRWYIDIYDVQDDESKNMDADQRQIVKELEGVQDNKAKPCNDLRDYQQKISGHDGDGPCGATEHQLEPMLLGTEVYEGISSPTQPSSNLQDNESENEDEDQTNIVKGLEGVQVNKPNLYNNDDREYQQKLLINDTEGSHGATEHQLQPILLEAKVHEDASALAQQPSSSLQDVHDVLDDESAENEQARGMPKWLVHTLRDSKLDAPLSSCTRSSSRHASYASYCYALVVFILHDVEEPLTFDEAQNPKTWMAAMQSEYDALIENGTRTLCDLPPSKKAIGRKWVYKLKCKPDGEIDRYKARLVAKGYAQQKGIDYEETFAPTCGMTTVRFLCALASHFGWDVHQSDIVSFKVSLHSSLLPSGSKWFIICVVFKIIEIPHTSGQMHSVCSAFSHNVVAVMTPIQISAIKTKQIAFLAVEADMMRFVHSAWMQFGSIY
ncbi:hypothetical protein L7F22_037878 [Adiantum nelumboides]|nr:hypothetical protein [Adiantum nelumboides]